MKRWKCLLTLTVLSLLCMCAAQAQESVFTLQATFGTVDIVSTELDGENWLFLPTFADPDALGLEWLDGWADAQGVRRARRDGVDMCVMQSANLRTLFLFSDDPLNQGRSYIENSNRHSAQTTGFMALVAADGRVDLVDNLRQLRGRGNGSWGLEKKPYQFKLENRADLLGTGDPEEKNRTWVLLAQGTDVTALRNRLALDLGLELGLNGSCRSEFVDLYYDGEYLGLYLLCEKVEIGQGRIDEADYDRLLESWNEGDLERHSAAGGTNRFGKPFTYIENVADNSMVDAGAYLLEMESINGATLSDRCFFKMEDGSTIALKIRKMPAKTWCAMSASG